MKTTLPVVALALAVALASPAFGQMAPEPGPTPAGEAPIHDALSGPPTSTGGPDDPMAAAAPREDSGSPHEREGQSYYFLGARFRMIFAPIWLQELFVKVPGLRENASGVNPAFGAEFVYRKDNFDIILALWYAGYRNGPTVYVGKDEPIFAADWTENGLNGGAGGLGVLFLSAEILWSAPINDMIAFVYGAAIGVGYVLGELRRTEAYNTAMDGSGTWGRCNGPGDPVASSPFWCEPGGSYGVRDASVPVVIPWIALPQIGFRIKPHRNFVIRIDGGFGIGFFAEIAAHIGF